jgi:methylmalonyl-CoA/ethylmalonyl-CoA epimerase
MQARFGTLAQIGYVVANIEAACRIWAGSQGVGPWLLTRGLAFEGLYDGEPTAPKLNVALAYQGGIQIELIEPLDDSPSPYRWCVREGRPGIHHIGYLVEDDIHGRIEQARAQGLSLRWDVKGHGGLRFAYLTLPGTAPIFVELIETPPWLRETFDQLQAAAATWDGRNLFFGQPD